MTKVELLERLKPALDNFMEVTTQGPEDAVTGCTISSAGSWEFAEMAKVSAALGTDKIDVMGQGCETCGYGAEIEVTL